jgi:murein DD-endopeptidase MepM/ murein hydrolase activator NlpD
MRAARLAASGLLALLLAGCIRDEPPAPVIDAENEAVQTPAPSPAPAAPVETPAGTVIVRPGQTLSAVAREANVPVRTLIDANKLQPPYRLRAGQSLSLPRTRQHIVQPGETLYAVARQQGVEASALARENHLNPPYTIKAGAVLILPAPVEAGGIAPPPAVPAPAPAVPPAGPVPPGPGTVAVVPLPPPAKPAPPAPAAGPETAQAPTPLQPAAPPAAPVEPVPAPSGAPPPERESGANPAPVPEGSAPSVAALVADHPDPVPPLFLWPVRGRILTVFGTPAAGAHNDGINIAAPEGTTVSAAESGIVAYAGNELRGFGNLLLIKHDDGWVTAYAHNQVLLVKKGQKIRRGQPIARVGSSGGVGQAQLHFELRRGTKAIDPLDHLPRLTGAG